MKDSFGFLLPNERSSLISKPATSYHLSLLSRQEMGNKIHNLQGLNSAGSDLLGLLKEIPSKMNEIALEGWNSA